jgi:dolichol-phosphate mannosyltransferase
MLSIVLPTYNEAANIPELLRKIAAVLKNAPHEIIVVDDDSPDKTWEVAQQLHKQYPLLKVIHRVGRRGLSSAVIEGFEKAQGDTLLVMDSDLQHDPALITKLTDAIDNGAGIAVASRYTEGGSVGEWVKGRRILSKTATFLARKIPPVDVSDPMSGFFAVKKSAYRSIAGNLRPAGFKILLEILAFLPRTTRTAEVPLVFKMREHGESKLNLFVELLFIWQLVRIAFHRVQKPLFWLIVFIALMTLLPRAWGVLPLYYDQPVRQNVQSLVTDLAQERGWLLSDIEFKYVTKTSFVFVHRQHHRGADEKLCHEWLFGTSAPIPCAD